MSDVRQDDAAAGEAAGLEGEGDPLWLSEDDFAADDSTVADGLATRPTEERAARLPGPGIPESLAWMGGMLGVQLIGGIIAAVAVILLYLADTGAFRQSNADANSIFTEKTLNLIQREYAGTLFGIIQTATVIGAATAVALRFGRERRRLLPLGPIPWRHLALIVAAVLPLVVVSSQMHIGASWAWEQITEVLPALKRVNDVNSMAAIEKLAKRTSFLGLLFMVAVAPAIAEELVFRGAIGRGLIARWGLPAGILITSLMFAAMHVHPPHAAALIPLAIFMHVAYIATRSFWAPVLVHFLNNALAVVVLCVLLELPESAKELDPSPRVSALMLGCSGFCVAMLIVSLWKSRVQFIDAVGAEWTPGYPAVERPPAEWGLQARCRPTGFADWAPAAVGLGVFVLGALLFAVLTQQGWHV